MTPCANCVSVCVLCRLHIQGRRFEQLANWRHEDQDAAWCIDKAGQAARASRQWSNYWLSNGLVNFAKMLHAVFDVLLMAVTSSGLACISHGPADNCARQVLDCYVLLNLSHCDYFCNTSNSDPDDEAARAYCNSSWHKCLCIQ